MWHPPETTAIYIPQLGCVLTRQYMDRPEMVDVILARYRRMIYAYRSSPMTFSARPLPLGTTEEIANFWERIDAANVTCDFAALPLSEAARRLQQATGLAVVLDSAAAEEEGVDLSVRVSLTARQAPLREALNAMLEPHGIGWSVQDEAILLFNPYDRTPYVTKMYPLLDLTHDSGDVSRPPAKIAEQLAAQLVREVSAGSWGEVECLPNGAALVVSHFDETHLLIERWLEQKRRSRK